MSQQTIRGKVVDGSSNPVPQVIIELQFSYGSSQVTGPGVKAQTDDNGDFSVDLLNDATGLDTCAVTIFDQIAHTFELDPESEVVNLGNITAPETGTSRPRLTALIPDIVPRDPKTAAIVIGATQKMYLLQSDLEVSGLNAGYSEGEGRYTYRGELDGKAFFLIETETGTGDPAAGTGFRKDAGDGLLKFYLNGNLIFSSGDSVEFPWEVVNWDQEGPQPGPPTCTESPEVKEITVAELAAAVDAILNP